MNQHITMTGFEIKTYAHPETGKWPHRVKVTHIPTGTLLSETYTGRETTGEMRDRMMNQLADKLKLPKGPWTKTSRIRNTSPTES